MVLKIKSVLYGTACPVKAYSLNGQRKHAADRRSSAVERADHHDDTGIPDCRISAGIWTVVSFRIVSDPKRSICIWRENHRIIPPCHGFCKNRGQGKMVE